MFHIIAIRNGSSYVQQFNSFDLANEKSLWLSSQGFTVEIKSGGLYV